MPFGPNCEWADMDKCIAANADKDDPSAWCATVMRETEEGCKEKHMVPAKYVKTVVPFKGQAPADRATTWSASAATKRGAKWAGGPDKDKIDWGKYRQLFVRYDADQADTLGGYHGPHTDIIGGSPQVVFKGVAALAVVLAGGRGGMAIPDGEVAGVKAHVAKHYHQFKDDNGDPEKAPWEREKDFEWLPEEKRAAARLKIDLTVARATIEADGAALATAAAARKTGDADMTTVLLIRNESDVSEEIEAPADGVFEEDVAAVSTDGGETWLELGADHRVTKEDDPAVAEAEAARVAEEAEAQRLADEDAAATAAAAAQAQADADAAAAAAAEAEAKAAADAAAEAAKSAPPAKHTLDHSLLGEMAATGFQRFFWNLTYALGDVLCDILCDDDNDGDESPDAKQGLADQAFSDFNKLAREGFAEALALTATEPEREDPFAGMSYAEAIHTILASAAADAAGLDPDAEASEDTTTEVNALQAQVTELQTKGSTDSKALADAASLIEQLLDMPLERKISDDGEDAAADINEKYPWLDPSLRRKLAAKAK